jgi:hypothetical protein
MDRVLGHRNLKVDERHLRQAVERLSAAAVEYLSATKSDTEAVGSG